MKILAIETSCDETAVAILEATGNLENPKFTVLGDSLYSQAHLHAEYGGVYPTLAKREHAKNLIPLLKTALQEAGLFEENPTELSEKTNKILEREPELLGQFIQIVSKMKIPDIDAIAVTQGPGLAPALWVGLNFAKALSINWNKSLIPINHMEGHVLSPLFKKGTKIKFPAISLLISGGHTQLVHVKDWFDYEIIGETKDDAVGEAFDKVARMLDLPYPGGPEISKLADIARSKELETDKSLPRPMKHSGDLNFSFSGLKTAVLYRVSGKKLDGIKKAKIAREFEDAVVDVLTSKTSEAIKQTKAKTLILGGGVIANKEIRKHMQILAHDLKIQLLMPEMKLATDNAIMIGIAGYMRFLDEKISPENIEGLKADGNLRL